MSFSYVMISNNSAFTSNLKRWKRNLLSGSLCDVGWYEHKWDACLCLQGPTKSFSRIKKAQTNLWSAGGSVDTCRKLQLLSEIVGSKSFSWHLILNLILSYLVLYRCFLKWWYPQNTPKRSFSVGKPMVVGYHPFRKRQYLYITDHWLSMHTKMAWGTTVRQTQSLLVQVRLEEPRVFALAKWKWYGWRRIWSTAYDFEGNRLPNWKPSETDPKKLARQANQGTCQKQATFWAAKLRLVSWSTPVLNWPAGRRLRFTDGWWLVVRVAFFFFFFLNLLDKPYRYGYWNWITLETYTQTSSYNNTLESFSYRAILHLDHLISVYPKCIMGSLSVSLEFFCLFQEAILEIPEHKADAKNLNNEIVKWVQDNCAGIPSHELHRFTGIWMVS